MVWQSWLRRLFVLVFWASPFTAFAQPNPGGPNGACLVIGAFGGTGYLRMYTVYNGLTSKYLLTPYSDWASSIAAANTRADGDSRMYRCAVWNGGYTLTNTCIAATSIGDRAGTLGFFTGTLSATCVPLDDYAYLLILIAGAEAFIFLRASPNYPRQD